MSLPEYASQRIETIEYPSSDGKPMADNTQQARWIISLYNNLQSLFAAQNVFVAADLLWYPVQGQPAICQAPDVMVAFGRPPGERSSYKQWEEGGVVPQVVFEVISPGNTNMEMMRKVAFYHQYGVEELIVIDPGKKEDDPESFLPYLRDIERMVAGQGEVVDWTSPRLGIRFRQEEGEVKVFYPDGSPFRSFVEIKAEWEAERARAEEATHQAEEATRKAEEATQQAAAEKQRADAAEAELARLRKLLEDRGEGEG